jgi:hypothetical protein
LIGSKWLGFGDYELSTTKKRTNREIFLAEIEAVLRALAGCHCFNQKMLSRTRSDTINPMNLDSYHAKIEHDEEPDLFRGEILGLSGGADFYGLSPDELRRESKKVTGAYS